MPICIGTIEMSEILSRIYEKYGTNTFTQNDLLRDGLASKSHIIRWRNKRFFLVVQKPKKDVPCTHGRKRYRPTMYKLSASVILLIENFRERTKDQ